MSGNFDRKLTVIYVIAILFFAGHYVYHRVQQEQKAHLAQLQQQAQQSSEAEERQYIQSELNFCIQNTGIYSLPALTPQGISSILSSSGTDGLDAYTEAQNAAIQRVQNCKQEYIVPNQ